MFEDYIYIFLNGNIEDLKKNYFVELTFQKWKIASEKKFTLTPIS